MKCPNGCIGDGYFDPHCEYCDDGKPIPAVASAGYISSGFEKAYDDRPKPLNMSIPLDGMYLYFYEAGKKELKAALEKIATDYVNFDCRTWRTRMTEIQNIARAALEI